MDPDGAAAWSLEAHLATLTVDALHVLAWQNTEDGTKGRNKPKPIPRPGVKEAREEKARRIRHSAGEWQKRRAARRAALEARKPRAAEGASPAHT